MFLEVGMLYAAIGFLCTAIMLTFLWQIEHINKYNIEKEKIAYKYWTIVMTLFFSSEIAFGVGYATGGNVFFHIIGANFVLMSLTAFSFCRYVIVFLGMEGRLGKILGVVSILFLILELSMIGLNFAMPIFFKSGKGGEYYPGIIRYIFYIVLALFFLLITILSLVLILKDKKEEKARHRIIFWSCITLDIFLVFKYFLPVTPSLSIGYLLAALFIRRFIHEEEFKYQMEELRNSNLTNKAKTVFLQNMSHEIRTPLNAIYGFAQLLGMPEGSWTDEEKEEYTGYIHNSFTMLDLLINDILDAADFGNGNYRITKAPMRVNEVCRNSLKSVELRCPSAVDLKFETTLDDDFTIVSDTRRIQQILVNYLTNACKNTVKGSITLKCTQRSANRIKFTVTDTGCGVPPEKAEAIFGRFTKLDRNVQGSGLGLNICHSIAEKLGGKVYLDTRYEKGARFVFELDT